MFKTQVNSDHSVGYGVEFLYKPPNIKFIVHASVQKSSTNQNKGYLRLNHGRRLRFWGRVKSSASHVIESAAPHFVRLTVLALTKSDNQLRPPAIEEIRSSWLSPACFSLLRPPLAYPPSDPYLILNARSYSFAI